MNSVISTLPDSEILAEVSNDEIVSLRAKLSERLKRLDNARKALERAEQWLTVAEADVNETRADIADWVKQVRSEFAAEGR
jgi:hypothetical protein